MNSMICIITIRIFVTNNYYNANDIVNFCNNTRGEMSPLFALCRYAHVLPYWLPVCSSSKD